MTIELKKITLRDLDDNFKDLTFSFENGKSYFIKGGNGIGKSTLINAMVGLHKPLSGSILYNGVDFYGDSRNERYNIRKKMGIIFDKPGLLSNLTIFENLKLKFLSIENVNLWEENWNKREIDIFIREELVDLGLENKKDLRPDLLSQGEIKKISISRALISNPKIIIWDDAFEGLSNEDKFYFEKKILNLKNKNAIIIFLNSWIPCKENILDTILDLNEWRKKVD